MNLTRSAIKYPAITVIIIIMIALTGIASLFKLPMQLFPNIEKKTLTVTTTWRSAAPQEVESELIAPQEKALQSVPGLETLVATASQGKSAIALTFGIDTDIEKAMIDVASRLNHIPSMPVEARGPVISRIGVNDTLTWLFLQTLPENDTPINDYKEFAESRVQTRLQSISGVGGVLVKAGAPLELQILFDPYKLQEYNIGLDAIIKVASFNRDVSGGSFEVGKRQYRLRFQTNFDENQLLNEVLAWRNGAPIRVKDVAEVKIERGPDQMLRVQNGQPALAIQVSKAPGANALDTLLSLKRTIAELNERVLKPEGLQLHQSFDASVFILRAIGFVSGSLFIGIKLAVGVLWFFFRHWRATLIGAISIPLSIMIAFTVLQLTGHTLNMISLAGLAFASGMVLDASIVALESIIFQRAKSQKPGGEVKAVSHVSSALVASTITTVAIFLPVLFMDNIEGQLFADLALTIAVAVGASLFIALTLIPLAAKYWLGRAPLNDRHSSLWLRMTNRVMKITNTPTRRYTVIFSLTVGVAAIAWLLAPKFDYLPDVKRDAVDVYFGFPAGITMDSIDSEILTPIKERLKPYMEGKKEPALKNYYILAFPNGAILGVRAKEQGRVEELQQLVKDEIVTDLINTSAYVTRGALFSSLPNARNIEIHLQLDDLTALGSIAKQSVNIIKDVMPGSSVRVIPGASFSQPELTVTADSEIIGELGINKSDLSKLVTAVGDGVYIGEYFDGSERINIVLRSENWDTPEQLGGLPINTAGGDVVHLEDIALIERTIGPKQIRRIDQRRTLTLMVVPPQDIALDTAFDLINNQALPQVQELMPATGFARIGISADNLNNAISQLFEALVMALVVLFLVLCALYQSIKDSLLTLLTIPLAGIGGIVALSVLNIFTFQALDLLTLIGFIILLGLVVNNAILLVYHARNKEREGLCRRDAVADAIQTRMRPILMSTLTSIFGMVPLVLNPGIGSEIYRGLGCVIVGGMTMNTIFTIVLLPALLRVGEGQQDKADASHDSEEVADDTAVSV